MPRTPPSRSGRSGGASRAGGSGAASSGRSGRPDRAAKNDPGARSAGKPARPAAPGRAKPDGSAKPAKAGAGGRAAKATGTTRSGKPAREHPGARRRRRETEGTDELRRLAGGRANKAIDSLRDAAEAYRAGRERDTLRILRPLLNAFPDAASVRELAGLAHYRIGNYRAAQRELEAFAALSHTTEQHPALMDSLRATGQFRRVEQLWRELGEASPSAALVTEGRIVMAGALADRGRRDEAIALLEKRATVSGRRAPEHQVRLWYALADLHERAGNLPRARALFREVLKVDAGFADVATRLAALG